jgi:FkbM family methyltransferase
MDNWYTVAVRFPRDDQELGFHLRVNPRLTIHRRMIASFRRKTMYAPATSNFLFNVLRDGDDVIDVGAHIGYYSLLASVLVGPTGSVIAFEPENRNFVQLKANVALNRRANIRTFQQGLWSTVMDAPFFVNPGRQDGDHCLLGPGPAKTTLAPQEETLSLLTLDDVVGNVAHPRFRVLKVSVNGAETAVLSGAARLLERQAVDFILCDYAPSYMRQMQTTDAELRSLLATYGYQCFGLTAEANLIPVPDSHQFDLPDEDMVLTLVFALPDAVQQLATAG